jgi:4-amino-4-deoxy-L-arabinose transferase-like glycosyltransferase
VVFHDPSLRLRVPGVLGWGRTGGEVPSGLEKQWGIGKMKLGFKDLVSNRWLSDTLYIALVLALNPITYFINYSTWRFPPDSIAYVTLGINFFEKGLLYLPSWAHVDNGVILPPLYPFLIACGHLFSGETLRLAEFISSISMLLSSVAIYLYVRRITNQIIALLTIAVIQINFYFFITGMVPLSEPVFLCAVSFSLFLVLHLTDDRHKNDPLALILGAVSAFAFFARQIGIVFFVFAASWQAVYALINGRNRRMIYLRNLLFICIGFFSLFLPYTIIVHHQTGQIAHKQSFRMGRYIVKAEDFQHLPAVREPRFLATRSYEEVYMKRRLMRELLPDSSEMFCSLYWNSQEESFGRQFFSIFRNPKRFFPGFVKNILFLREPLGTPIFSLFLIFCLSPFVVSSRRIRLSQRLVVPVFLAFYFVILSYFTDSVGRYVYILFPLVIIFVAVELYVLLIDAPYVKRKNICVACFALFFLVVLYSTPRYFYELKVHPKFLENRNRYCICKGHIEDDDPAFGLSPISTYLVGAAFRTLPNDCLEKVVIYARRTGVKWLVVDRTGVTEIDRVLYNNAQWYWSTSIEEDYPGLVRCSCRSTDGSIALYEVL